MIISVLTILAVVVIAGATMLALEWVSDETDDVGVLGLLAVAAVILMGTTATLCLLAIIEGIVA